MSYSIKCNPKITHCWAFLMCCEQFHILYFKYWVHTLICTYISGGQTFWHVTVWFQPVTIVGQRTSFPFCGLEILFVPHWNENIRLNIFAKQNFQNICFTDWNSSLSFSLSFTPPPLLKWAGCLGPQKAFFWELFKVGMSQKMLPLQPNSICVINSSYRSDPSLFCSSH